MSEKKEKTIYQKLLKAKKEFTTISKDQKNPHFKSAYYDINAMHKMVDPILHELGLMIMNPIVDGKIVTQVVDVESGKKIEASFNIEYNPNPQKVGSEITYYRRYLISALLGLQAEDDDGNMASTKKPAPKKQEPKPTPKTITNENLTKGIKQVQDGDIFVFDLEEKLKGYELTKEQQVLIDELKKNQKNK